MTDPHTAVTTWPSTGATAALPPAAHSRADRTAGMPAAALRRQLTPLRPRSAATHSRDTATTETSTPHPNIEHRTEHPAGPSRQPARLEPPEQSTGGAGTGNSTS